MLTSAIYSSLSAMHALSTGVHGTAYNLENLNTAGFNPVSVHYSSGPRSSHGLETGVRPVVSRTVPPMAETTRVFQPSRTDLAREMVNLAVNQNAFDANAQVIRASDELLGGLVDVFV